LRLDANPQASSRPICRQLRRIGGESAARLAELAARLAELAAAGRRWPPLAAAGREQPARLAEQDNRTALAKILAASRQTPGIKPNLVCPKLMWWWPLQPDHKRTNCARERGWFGRN
jgi:hypothetical protein